MVDLLIGCLHGPWAEELIRGAVDAAREAAHSIVATTVSAMTAAGFRMLRMGADGSAAVPQHVELATGLVVRDSTAPPKR